jgi:hypothetical protein
MNILTDWGGFIKRNSKNWDKTQLKKVLNEINQIKYFIEKKLKEKGVA